MKINVRSWLPIVAVASALLLAACGGSGGGATGVNVSTPGEQLQFSPATASAKAGTATTVTFKNGSAAQKHNWVLIKGGDAEAQKVDDEGATAGEAGGYIPSDPNIVASIKLLNGNESGTASVNVPAGTYTYICTFPGHYVAGMKGTLTVQ